MTSHFIKSTIIILRSKDRAQCLKEILLSKGYKVIIEPIISIYSYDYVPIDFNKVDAIMFTSVNSVKILKSNVNKKAIKNIKTYCVGDITEKWARKSGFNCVRTSAYSGATLEKAIIKNSKNKKPTQVVKYLARAKAKSINFKYPQQLVVGCDTIILFDNKIIDKAQDLNSAQKQIKKLSGKEHKIISAASIYKNKKQIWSCIQTSKVKIRKLSTKNINHYISVCGEEILKSAGCYQIESCGPLIIENIKGDFFNVMGFPLFPFLLFLKKLNIKK